MTSNIFSISSVSTFFLGIIWMLLRAIRWIIHPLFCKWDFVEIGRWCCLSSSPWGSVEFGANLCLRCILFLGREVTISVVKFLKFALVCHSKSNNYSYNTAIWWPGFVYVIGKENSFFNWLRVGLPVILGFWKCQSMDLEEPLKRRGHCRFFLPYRCRDLAGDALVLNVDITKKMISPLQLRVLPLPSSQITK